MAFIKVEKVMRRAAGTTPHANGRALDFDHLDRHKRTRRVRFGIRNVSPAGDALKEILLLQSCKCVVFAEAPACHNFIPLLTLWHV
jgi:hypothetical protein